MARPKRRAKSEKLCPNCAKPVVGHPNKKFCSSTCKDRFHNQAAYNAGYRYAPVHGKEPTTPWDAAGVSKEKYEYYAKEYGGTPLFDRHGEYEGFIPTPFDNTLHQNHE
jgi:hypothetical protein